MDEDFAGFLEDFGPAIDKQEVPTSSIERYRGTLPDQLLSYWQEHGWCGYADGLFWTVNPEEYEPVLDAWIGETPFMAQDEYHLIARGAFGDLCFFGGRTGNVLHLVAPDAIALAPGGASRHGLDFSVRTFFGSRSRRSYDFSRTAGPLFAPALKKLGQLKRDEMYGFVPALALGGQATLDHLQKVKAVEHLVLLSQLAPLKVMG